MNEQDRIMEEKILKREKTDTFLAYMLIIILLGCIGFVLYAKFIMKHNEVENNQGGGSITLTDISSSLNASNLANNYQSDGATFTSLVSNNALVVTYIKDTNNINLNIPLINNELAITLEDNNEVIDSIYKEIGTIICTYYQEDESSCRNILNLANSNTNGIRIEESDNTKIVYLSMNNDYFVNNASGIYTESTIVSLGNTNYELNINNVNVSNINIKNNTTNVVFSGNLTTTSGNYPFDVIVKLYKEDESLIKEDKVTISDNSTNNFSITFNFDDTLKLEELSKYSIDIIR